MVTPQVFAALLAAACLQCSSATEESILREAEAMLKASVFDKSGVTHVRIDSGSNAGDIVGYKIGNAAISGALLGLEAMKNELTFKPGSSEAIAKKVVAAIVKAIRVREKRAKAEVIPCAKKLIADDEATC